jgi:hypothetical protein
MERNSELFSLPRSGSERIPRVCFRGMVRTEFLKFSVLRNRRDFLSKQTIFVYRIFRLPRIYFFVGNYQPYLRVFTVDLFPSCFLFREMVQNEFREFASIFVPRYGIPSIFLFRGMVRTELREFSVLWNSRNFL